MELRDYQLDLSNKGLKVLSEHSIVYLALEPRVGKTIISLTIAKNIGAKKVLFITKKKAIGSIEKDYKLGEFNYFIVVVNYESVHTITDLDSYDLIVCDEIHCLSAYAKPSSRAKTVKEIVGNKKLIMLSGSPSPESYSQLFHQFWISENSPFKEYKNFYKWAKDYVKIGTKYIYGRNINDYSNAKKDLIKQATDHLFITYSQEQAGFKTKIEEEVLMCDGGVYLANIRKILKKDLVYTDHVNNFEIVADTAVRLQQLDHQLSSGTVIDREGNRRIIDPFKANFIKEYFQGKKIAIFYKFNAELDLLKKVFPNHTLVPEEFNDTNTYDTFLGQFVSSREGTRLDTADALIFINIDFASLSYFQSKERIMSFERTEPAKLYWIFSNNGIERKIYDVVVKKKDFTLSYYLKSEGIQRNRFRIEGSEQTDKTF